MTPVEVRLSLPREREFTSVAHLVLGGLAARLDLTFEELADLELALDGLLERDQGEGEITVSLRVHEGELRATVGPFDGDALRDELDPEAGERLGLRRILDALADDVAVCERGGQHWLEVRKSARSAGRGGP